MSFWHLKATFTQGQTIAPESFSQNLWLKVCESDTFLNVSDSRMPL